MRVNFRGPRRREAAATRPRLAAIGASGPHEHQIVKRKTRIGNVADNDLVIPDATVSGHHAIIKRRFRRYRLIDLESTNGTFVNGRRVSSPAPVSRGDELRFGGARFVFLQSPKTRELRRRVPLSTVVALLLVIFASAFAVVQHFLNRSLFEQLTETSRSESKARSDVVEKTQKINQPLWLQRVNYYRQIANLTSVTEDLSFSHADYLHSRYLVKYQLRTQSEHFAHSEDPSDPYYTPEGLKAAQNSDLAEGDNTLISGVQAIDSWMNGPFHRLSILDPEALKAGLGSYTEGGLEAIGLYLMVPSSPPHPFSEPVEFPPPDSTVPLAIYEAGEWPNPLTACTGYNAPTGLPVTLQLGAWIPVQVSAHSFTHDGTALEHCVFDAATYTNPDEATQTWARQGLQGSSAVVLIPRAPLTSGERYSVSISVGTKTYSWSFLVQ